MGILLIDSSSLKIEFGFAGDNKILFSKVLDPGYNADTLTYFIREAFTDNGVDFKEIEYTGLSNGPGSFTGLRIGSAIAKGICFALGSKLIEIPTLDVIANKFCMENKDEVIHSGKKLTALIFSNSRTGEFYYCTYEFISGRINRISDYGIDNLENIMKRGDFFILNEKFSGSIDKEFHHRLTDVSAKPVIESLFQLVCESIRKNNFSDFRKSEPFYIKEFVPKI